jgi:hypothetical protein
MPEYTDYLRRRSTPPTNLTEIICEARRRWRLKLALRGLVRAVIVVLALLFAAAYGMEWARFSPTSILAARMLIGLAIIGSLFYFLVRPLRRRVTDEQVALYLEEHEPSLQATLMSAVEASKGSGDTSAALVRKLVEQALEVCASTDAARRVEDIPLKRWGAVLAGAALASILAVALGPAFLRNALSAILLVQRSVEAAAPYRIEVTPGNATVPKGADQTVSARLSGFGAEDATLMVRRDATSTFEEMPLVRGDDGAYEGMIFDVAASMQYFVEAEGVRSPLFTLNVVEVPYVQRLEMEYHFPAYTGLEPQKIEDGGDVAVLRGTEVRLRAIPTMKTSGGRVALNDKESVELKLEADGSLTAAFKADRDGFYRIEFESPTKERVAASPQYTIDVLTDQPPTVSFAKPGRDTSASSIEEVFLEAQAEDDFGVRDLELVYSVNGGPEKTVKLFGGRTRLPEVTAGHTLYLEELGVQAGDSVSYYARAIDNDAVGGGKRATSDLYFLRVRPFQKDFRQAQSQGGGGGGMGGGGGQVEALSEQQRQIISATFNVQRDRRTVSADKLRESTTVVGLAQSRLREQVEGLLTRMNSQLVQRDPAFAKIAEMLPQAVEAMKEAEGQLAQAKPDTALPPEHKALQILQKAEEEYEQQISVQRGGGGGGGAGSAQAQELAEIFEQELQNMANRYETANQAQQQDGDRQVDELLEKLRELARRQEQEAARQRLRALEQGGGSSGGSSSGGSSAAQQRALAEQAEEAARRLERLAREENRPDLQDAARQLQQAADAMRRAAAGGDAAAAGQAQQALERLRETEKRLQQQQAGRAERDINDAMRQADELARQQQEIAEDVRGLASAPSGTNRREQARGIDEQKNQLEGRLTQLEQQLDRAARDAASTERAASRKMAEAAGSIRDNRLADKIRYSQNLVNRGATPGVYNAAENEIGAGIEELRKRLNEAAGALGEGNENANRMETALERARRLARAAESLRERTAERGQQGQAQRGQNGRDGDRGEQQGNQQGQNAQNEGGQQGQRGQGQGQGQQGSEGSQGSQGSEGSQGSGSADGSPGQGQMANGRAGGDGAWGGGINNGYGYGWEYGRNWRLTPEDIRQLRGEVRQWTGEAMELRRDLQAENIDPRDLDEILRALRQLDDPRVYQNASELQRLQSVVAEGLKRFEFGLRRQADANQNAVVLSGSDEVPEDFRKLVEQYFRSLGKGSAR